MADVVRPRSGGPEGNGETATARQTAKGALTAAIAVFLTAGGIAWALDFYRWAGLDLDPAQYVAGMLAVAMPLAFLVYGPKRGVLSPGIRWTDLALGMAGFVAAGYLAIEFQDLSNAVFYAPWPLVTAGIVLFLLILELLRRSTGWALVIISVVFVGYALIGHLMPGSLAGKPVAWQMLSSYLAVDVNGLLGLPMKVATIILISFILFGHLLSRAGGSHFFTDLALVGMGRYRGGGAKIAVVASGLFGSISGSAVANVVSTGVVTIPMIKRSGFHSHQAGAIEAVASTGGQLMPPVMGAAAFLMADYLQISYGEVALAALVPALLYYTALFIQADLIAARAGISRVDENLIPRLKAVLRGSLFIIPFVVLIMALFTYNLQPQEAALLACGSVVLIGMPIGYRGERLTLRGLFDAVRATGIASLEVILVCAAAGFVIGSLNISGLGFNLTNILVQVGSNSLILLLLLAAVISIVLGMGLPTLAVYVLLATLVAGALIKLGIPPIAAHLYVMYFGMMSMITPPIAIAVFAAASLAGAPPMRTGFSAMRFGWTAYVVPILFAFSPSLLLIGATGTIALTIVTAIIGVWLVSIAMAGYFARPLGPPMRGLFAAAGLAALIPANAFDGAEYTDIAGAIIGLVLIGRELLAVRAQRAEGGVSPPSRSVPR